MLCVYYIYTMYVDDVLYTCVLCVSCVVCVQCLKYYASIIYALFSIQGTMYIHVYYTCVHSTTDVHCILAHICMPYIRVSEDCIQYL